MHEEKNDEYAHKYKSSIRKEEMKIKEMHSKNFKKK